MNPSLKMTKKEDLDKIVLLLQGKIFPNTEERKIGISSKLILKALNIATGISQEELVLRGRMTGRSEARKLFAFLGTRVLGYTGKEIADFLGVTNQAVSAMQNEGRKIAKEKNLEKGLRILLSNHMGI